MIVDMINKYFTSKENSEDNMTTMSGIEYEITKGIKN